MRVAAPGARIGVIVRSLDLPQWWNLALPEPIRRKVAQTPRSLAAEELPIWHAARDKAEEDGVLMTAWPLQLRGRHETQALAWRPAAITLAHGPLSRWRVQRR
jgi:hypothetical protein